MEAPSKSCEMDPIPTDVLKKFLPAIVPFITDICNLLLQQGNLLPSQRHAIIRPRIKKAGLDPTDVQKYRPVSNLTFMSKVVEKLVCHQLVAFLEHLNLLPDVQSAYRRKYSMETAVLKVITDVCYMQPMEEKSLCCVCWILHPLWYGRSWCFNPSPSASFGIRGGDWLSHGSNPFGEVGHSQSVLMDNCRPVQFWQVEWLRAVFSGRYFFWIAALTSLPLLAVVVSEYIRMLTTVNCIFLPTQWRQMSKFCSWWHV